MKSRKFAFIFYKEDETHVRAMQLIHELYSYAAILHDKDYDVNGEIKKEHYHYIIKTNSPQNIETICNTLLISTNYCRVVKNDVGFLRYLIHYDDLDKFQYSIDEVYGDLKINLKKILNSNLDEGRGVLDIIQIINDNKIVSLKILVPILIEKGLFEIFKKNTYMFVNMLKEYK